MTEEFGEPSGLARCRYLDLGQAFEMLILMRDRGVPTQTAASDPLRELGLDDVGYGNFATDAGWFGFWLTPRSPDGFLRCPDGGT